MIKKYGAFFMVIVLTLIMVFQTGCASKDNTTKPESNTESKTESKTDTKPEGNSDTKSEGKTDAKSPQNGSQILALGTQGAGSIINAMASGISAVLSRNFGSEVKTVATSGPGEWMPMMNTNEIDMGLLNAWDAQTGYLGKAGYEKISAGKGFDIRLITSGHKAANGIIVAESTGIKSGADLKGKRIVGNFTGSAGQTMLSEAALANLGLTKNDVKMTAAPSVDAGLKSVIEGRADANGCANLGMGAISELEAGKGARFLSLDPSPEAVKRLQELFPANLIKVSPGKGNTGIKEDPTYLMQYDFYMVGRASLSDDVVYNVVKTLWDKNNELGALNKNLLDWTPENFVVDLFTVPYHPGAIKFYQEKGVWTPEMEKRQQELLASKK